MLQNCVHAFNFETCFKFCWEINILLARRKSIWRQTVRWNIPRLHFFPIHYSTGIQPQSFYKQKNMERGVCFFKPCAIFKKTLPWIYENNENFLFKISSPPQFTCWAQQKYFTFYLVDDHYALPNILRSGWLRTQRDTPAGTGWLRSRAWRGLSRFICKW